VVFGLFWKRSAGVAVATLLAAWILNCAWSFTNLASALGGADIPNAYVTLGITMLVGVIGNLITPGRDAYFRSTEYAARRSSPATAAA
jgi:predicted phage tail protein